MVEAADGEIDYRSRRHIGGVSTRFTVRPTPGIIEPDPLANFLTARWAMHTRVRGATRFVPNEHEPWPLQAASLEMLDDELVAAAGLAGVAGRHPDSVLYSEGVSTTFGLPVR